MSSDKKLLSDFATVISGYAFKSEWFGTGNDKVIRIGDLQDGFIQTDSALTVDSALYKISDNFKIKSKDILMALSGATVGKIAVASKLDTGAYINQRVAIIRAKDEITADYLKFFFSGAFLGDLLKNAGGAAQPNLSPKQLLLMEIPFPPLEEQRRIASILDITDKLRQKRQHAIEKLDQLLQATFIDMFGDPVLNTKKWPSDLKLGDIADIASGITKGRKVTGKILQEIPYLAVSNVQDKYLNLKNIKTIEATAEEISRYKLQQGDLLLTEGGDPDKLGRGTLWNNEIPECIHQNHVFRVRITSKNFTPNYLNWIVSSDYGKRYFLKSAKQTTGIASINMGQLKRLPLLTPPIALQVKFDHKCEKISQLKKLLEKSNIEVDNLFKSLQNKAFSGNL